MAKGGAFPGPKYNDVIDKDPQIVQVPLEVNEWGGRSVSQSSPTRTDTQTIKHVKSEK